MKLSPRIPTAALPPIEAVAHQEYEYYASTATTNYVLKIVVLALATVIGILGVALTRASAAAAHVRPYIVRISEIGRAEAVAYQPSEYKPQAPEIRYFLTKFTHDYFSRVHQTIRNDYVNSLWFLDRQLFQQVDMRDRKTQWLPKFVASPDDDADVTVKTVAIEDLEHEPYRARVEFTKIFTNSAGAESKREQWTAEYVFRVNPNVPNEAVPHNPLGIAISYFRSDQAFE
jgi:type IV secretory pathway TrbF-like protein